MSELKIGYFEHGPTTYYVQIEMILKRKFVLTKDKKWATPLNLKDQKAVKRLDNRVKFEDVVEKEE